MKRKDTPTPQGGPSLFDGLNPQGQPGTGQAEGTGPAALPDDWADVLELADELRADAKRAGIWLLLPPETLLRRAEVYYNQRVGQIRETMEANGADADTVNVVCSDYAALLGGQFKFRATPAQMGQALRSLQPYDAFTIDRYGLYFGLLITYYRFLLRLKDYDFAVKGIHATEDTKREYISGFYPAMDARAVRWLLNIGYFEPADFSGFDPAEMNAFFARIAEFADFGEYSLYYTIARLALLATPQELADVEAPPSLLHTQTSVTEYYERVVAETVENLNRAGEKFAEAVKSETHAEREQARQAGTDWHDETNAQPVKIHENYGIVLSRPVKVSPNGSEVINTLPVQRYIDEFNENPASFSNLVVNATLTQMTVQKVFEGVNLLASYLSGSMQIGDNGRYTYHTTITEFSEICGYADANQEEKRALLGGLLLLSNLYFVLDKPKKYAERVNAKGRTVRYNTGGRVALRFLNVPKIGLDSGELIIEVYPESLRGRPTFLTPDTYKQLRAEAKGLAQSRFNYQIATKSHKSEIDLIDEVFGFRDMLEYADADEMPKVKKYVQGHRAQFRGKILGWFDAYVKAGILTEFKREPSKTNKRDFVLSWVCPDPSKLTPPPYDPDAGTIDEQLPNRR